MRTLNANERDPRVINGTIRNIQKVINTTTDGETVVRMPNETIALTLGTGFGGAAGESQIDLGSGDFYTAWIVGSSAAMGGPGLTLMHDSASPTLGDYVGNVAFYGRDSEANRQPYGEFDVVILDATNGSEDSQIITSIQSSGSTLNALTLGAATAWNGSAGPAHQFNFGAASSSTLNLINTAADAGGPILMFCHDSVSPAANDTVGDIKWGGRDDAGNATTYASLSSVISDPANGSEDSVVGFQTLVAGAAGFRVIIGGGLYHGSATGGDKGDNTINFGAVYDDNALLTCYGLGTGIDAEFFHTHAPDGEHGPLNAFLARLGTEYDPSTLAGQRKHVTDKKHLTPYPNPTKYTERMRPSIGGWVQSGVEMDELLFTYICALEDRIERLENAAV